MKTNASNIWFRAGLACKVCFCLGLGAGAVPLAAGPFADLQLTYLATFGHGSLQGSVDKFDIGMLKPGDSLVADINSSWTPLDGAIELALSQPVQPLVGPVGAGLFATPVNFATGSNVGLSATFIAPMGPHNTGNLWAVGLGARTGDENDRATDTRASATFQVRGNTARLNVVGASSPANQPNIPQEVYDAIFDSAEPEPFTLELLVDRTTGHGVASLKVGDWATSHQFQLAAFQAGTGPAITAVGPSVGISSAPGQRASVGVCEFRIYTIKPREQRR